MRIDTNMVMRSLTEEQVINYKEVFDAFDSDKNGFITKLELQSLLEKFYRDVSQSDAEKLISKIDRNDDGMLDFEEFLTLMASFDDDSEENLKEQLQLAFKTFDKNDDGKISLEELKYALQNIGEKFTEEEVKEMLESADSNGDGYIDFPEFLTLMGYN